MRIRHKYYIAPSDGQIKQDGMVFKFQEWWEIRNLGNGAKKN